MVSRLPTIHKVDSQLLQKEVFLGKYHVGVHSV